MAYFKPDWDAMVRLLARWGQGEHMSGVLYRAARMNPGFERDAMYRKVQPRLALEGVEDVLALIDSFCQEPFKPGDRRLLEKPWLNRKEAAQLSGYKELTVYSYSQQGKIVRNADGLYSTKSLLKYLKRQDKRKKRPSPPMA